MIGKLFNSRYQIVEKLGAGGTAIVYRGLDTLLNRSVTIKILREEYASNAEFVRRFQHEAQAVASLSHPNIVSVYDVGFEENMHYIVMEFIEGESLKEYIKRKGVLKLSEACNIITQILSGVEHAHEHGIIHRDIKPHNILLGKDGRAKVTDFGIAVGLSEVTMTYNSSSRIMGSVHYISPEQVQGLAVTEKSDIYSVGVVFYEMLTGRLPFVGETPISIAMQHVQGELILPHQVNPQVPMGVSYVVMRAMRKNPETRYANAWEMAEAVKAAYTGVVEGSAEEEKDSSAAVARPRVRERSGAAKGNDINRPSGGGDGKSNLNRVLLLVLAVLLVVGIVFAASWLLKNSGDRPVIMPDLANMTEEQANAALVELELVGNFTYKNSEEVAAGLVLSQSVAKDLEVSKGRVIDVVISSGRQMTEVPDLLTQATTERMAKIQLENVGLVPVFETEFNEEIPKGQVIAQSPLGGQQVLPGSQVTVLISDGKEPVEFTMADLVGMTQSEAVAYIDSKDLVLGTISQATSYTFESGKVTAQSIEPQSTTKSGTEINLTVSNGPGPVEYTHQIYYVLEPDNEYDEQGNPVEKMHTVTIKVDDQSGTGRPAYEQQHAGGSTVNTTVTYNMSGTIILYVDGVEKYRVQV